MQEPSSDFSDPPSSPDTPVKAPKSKVQKTEAAAPSKAAKPAPKNVAKAQQAKPAPKKVVAIDDSDADESEDDSEAGKEDVAPVEPADRPTRSRGEKKTYVVDDSEAGSDEDEDEESDEDDDDFDMED